MTNANRPLPSVELAKLNVKTMRTLNEMLAEIDELNSVAETLEVQLAGSPKFALGASEVIANAQKIKAQCATTHAKIAKLKVELSK